MFHRFDQRISKEYQTCRKHSKIREAERKEDAVWAHACHLVGSSLVVSTNASSLIEYSAGCNRPSDPRSLSCCSSMMAALNQKLDRSNSMDEKRESFRYKAPVERPVLKSPLADGRRHSSSEQNTRSKSILEEEWSPFQFKPLAKHPFSEAFSAATALNRASANNCHTQ